jgi:hypothetical protein
MPLFTARGERRWVPGWAPEFPAGEPSEENEGTVFVTRADGRPTYWVVALKEAGRVRYGRTTPGYAAGTVEVRLRDSDARATVFDVTYDLSALTAEGATELETFAAEFEADIGSWQTAIATALANDVAD